MDVNNYVEKFKLDVEAKFQGSNSNKNFVFPKNLKNKNNESIESLKDASQYDLYG